MSGKVKLILMSLVFTVIGFQTVNSSYAQTMSQPSKDTDFDGILDNAEVDVYKTDPTKADTDGDGILDAQEILENTNPLDANSGTIQTYKQITEKSVLTKDAPIFWYVGRVAGISAFIMFTLVVCLGLSMTSKLLLKVKFLSAPNALETHSFTATFIGLVLVILHLSSFMLDDVLQLSLKEALVPYLAQRDIKSAMGLPIGLAMGSGIVAFYLSIVLVLTSQFRRKIVSIKWWRKIHYLSFLFYFLILGHGFFAGTDSTEWWMKSIYSGSSGLVLTLLFLRIFGKKYFIESIRSKVGSSGVGSATVDSSSSSEVKI